MRPILLLFFLDDPWTVWKLDPVRNLSGPGLALVVAALALAYVVWSFIAHRRVLPDDRPILGIVAALLAALTIHSALDLRLLPAAFPLFGYGVTVLAGVLSALWLTRRRAMKSGIDPELVIDLALWVVVGGVLGGRIAYLVQFRDEVFLRGMSWPQAIFAAVNLTAGGLVLIGALFGGFLGMLGFCRARGQSLLKFADLVFPSVFVGIGFGRIGCLLNGCCFGEPTGVPWAITFPPGSLPFKTFVFQKLLPPDAAATMPIHPTQIYSALDGFLEALILSWFFWRKRRDGEVFALACLMYATSRFLMEFLRGDSPGVFGTPLTISQVYALGIFAAGLALWVYISTRPASQATESPAIGQPVPR